MGLEIAVFWHRRDLRFDDNAGLYQAQQSGLKVMPIFIFDTTILTKLTNKADQRVLFIHEQLQELKAKYASMGSDILVLHGNPIEVFEKLLTQYNIKAVYTNTDYEPYAISRDLQVAQLLSKFQINWQMIKDQCIFEKSEIVKDDGLPYTVFTPYSRKWKAALTESSFNAFPNNQLPDTLFKVNTPFSMPKLEELGFSKTETNFPSKEVKQQLIAQYHLNRDYPAIRGTSRLGIHFRFGTISIREKARKAKALNDTFLNELIWRDFYMMILYHFPKVATQAFRPEYDYIQWRNNEEDFKAWCDGRTGYPIVDAGMRELNATGYMHNRVRMITASFLTKHLLIDWRWGEAYFAEKLLDFDLSANNGGWQWAAGCGTDAAPYFRIFNPTLQAQRFDKEGKYIKQWIPELLTPKYPKPIVEHTLARKRCVEVYKAGLSMAPPKKSG
ncbi:MAG: DNA photolyase family protein [Bacteroidia bacterium]|jgi:deoxyribodipyrimidine photo-lyase|nr:DNA photolyase family protein [Bacteroidia bacterium]